MAAVAVAADQEPHELLAPEVALLLGATGDDLGERAGALDPLGHEHALGVGDDVGHEVDGVAGVGGREDRLGGRLERVVELLLHARLQLGDQRLDVEAGGEDGEQS